MHVTERPVVVAVSREVTERARCVRRVPLAAVKRGVQHAHIEQIGLRLRIPLDQILRHLATAVSLSVHRHAELIEDDGFRSAAG